MEKKFQPNYGENYPPKIFAHQLITVDDLIDFKKELLINNYLFRYKDPTVTGYYHNIFRPPIS